MIGQHASLARALARSGRITFARFMELALYDARHGYYARQAQLGARGDFYTSPELHPYFAASIAARAEALWRTMGCPPAFDLVEAGGGSGRFARDLLRYTADAFPALNTALRYRIDDRGTTLREQQRILLSAAGLESRVSWTRGGARDWLPGSINGLIVANELLDALPVHLVTSVRGELKELYVTMRDGQLALEPGPASTPRLAVHLRSLGIVVPDGAQWEVSLKSPAWLRRASAAVASGGVLIIDYGYDADSLYSPTRPQGTLLSYLAHTVSSDPLVSPGSRDITAHVDLTTVRRTLRACDLTIVEDRAQAHALAHSVDGEALDRWRAWTLRSNAEWTVRSARVRALEALLDPGGLGRVRWILATRDGIAAWEVPPPSAGASMEMDHLVLPDPAALDPFPDIEEQWRELWKDEPED